MLRPLRARHLLQEASTTCCRDPVAAAAAIARLANTKVQILTQVLVQQHKY
jgi:hypothetical protein